MKKVFMLAMVAFMTLAMSQKIRIRKVHLYWVLALVIILVLVPMLLATTPWLIPGGKATLPWVVMLASIPVLMVTNPIIGLTPTSQSCRESLMA